MSKQERFTASLNADLKKRLEEVAENNYRKLNGELNVAVEFYLKYGVSKVVFSSDKDNDDDSDVNTDKPLEIVNDTPSKEVSEGEAVTEEVQAAPTITSKVRGKRI